MWLRAFWGFGPEDGGYLGFTNEGNRDRFIREYQDGDLVLIYGADQDQTRPEQRRQLLGFLEIEPVPIVDSERSSEAERHRKLENGWKDRWTYAVPVKRAWRVNRRIEAHNLARTTFATHNPVLIASRCELLTQDEAERALALPVTPANVYGEPPLPLTETQGEAELRRFFQPSAGVTPTFGDRAFTIEDGENRLYVLKLDGDVASFLGRSSHETIGKVIVKVGHAKEPKQRCATHNAHLPTACAFRWTVSLISRPFPGGEQAKSAEDNLKKMFNDRFESLGGEFFWVMRIRYPQPSLRRPERSVS
ncbi:MULTISPECIES: hypothetical protein [unclassified Bradyrhizobium]|uniref:hypothetical protein n=1 Tax=unclassified Bradyrhizobium TaxID=2631580 RepID=UPI001FF830F3|nr:MULTISPECIES: hypothetical protein [unclassified Bradyrhizobium]MCK1668877.1 GIY-YIG nuclease family protein [Bradyrhizobium sp. 153]MCK1755781.1 GIY-YIG nuclease family protein [Bradyrhizobium sp. 137]